ncbi:MAG: transcriptional regulator [Cytophagales bacterium CG12_big_fil_rev_8_21_14_0_65_40_12]|nr:MAG: transcriptional regulator [Cytophagales bacterium CG12_big_fil_rev_8_21_14_0_65_40_12]PIW04113.1 MAG: transcriptional regulator [Cytophagales bacterium CG17_big_fil_post_rev_8_21_14_2_50_40_13]
MNLSLSQFVKQKRKSLGLTQEDLSFKSGVGLRFIRELEQGKPTLQMHKVNQVLKLFGKELGPVELNIKQLTDEEG